MNYLLIPFTNIFIGILVAYAYRHSSYRFFFYLSAFSDVISLMLWSIFSISSQGYWIPFNYLIVFSLNDKFLIDKKFWVLGGLLPIIILNHFSTTQFQYYFVLGINLIILFQFLRYFLIDLINFDGLNIFLNTMLLYEIIIIVQLIAIINDIELGVNVFYVGVFIQIFIGIFLILIRKGLTIPIGETSKKK